MEALATVNVPRGMIDAFEWQASWCESFGSPFTAALLRAAVTDIQAGSPVARLTANWADHPIKDAVSLRLAGALHAAVLTGRDNALTRQWPAGAAADGRDWDMATAWPIARAFLDREFDWVADFMTSAPQTNEVRRSVALFAGLQVVAADWDGPIDLLELGASAGLNGLFPDNSYACRSWQWTGSSGVTLDTDWHGPPPPLKSLHVRSLGQCDINPLNAANQADRFRLRAYIWPDQADRLARLNAAIDAARTCAIHPDKADAAAWLSDKLASRAGDAMTVVYHSIFFQYPPAEVRAAITAAMDTAGEAATGSSPLVWLRLEPEAAVLMDGGSPLPMLDCVQWPGGQRTVLSNDACPHGRLVHWQGMG
jgi:hypothetical protein